MQLFCFPYAGGTSAFYDQLEKELPTEISVIKLDYAGHGSRRGEPKYGSFSELADDMYTRMKAARDEEENYAMFGYSMGGLCVYELLRRLCIEENNDEPIHLFLAAHSPHPEKEFLAFRAPGMDNEVRELTLRFGGIDRRLKDNNAFWRVYLPIYQWDYYLIGTCEDRLIEMGNSVPATVFYSETDTPYREMRDWERYLNGNCDFFRFDGNHFFMNDHCAEIADIICRRLLPDRKK